MRVYTQRSDLAPRSGVVEGSGARPWRARCGEWGVGRRVGQTAWLPKRQSSFAAGREAGVALESSESATEVPCGRLAAVAGSKSAHQGELCGARSEFSGCVEELVRSHVQLIAHPRSEGAARSAAPARVGWLSGQKQRKNTHANEASWQTTPRRRFNSSLASPSRNMRFSHREWWSYMRGINYASR